MFDWILNTPLCYDPTKQETEEQFRSVFVRYPQTFLKMTRLVHSLFM